jgi:hypothetical protein
MPKQSFQCGTCEWRVERSPGYSGTVVCDNPECPDFNKQIGFAHLEPGEDGYDEQENQN